MARQTRHFEKPCVRASNPDSDRTKIELRLHSDHAPIELRPRSDRTQIVSPSFERSCCSFFFSSGWRMYFITSASLVMSRNNREQPPAMNSTDDRCVKSRNRLYRTVNGTLDLFILNFRSWSASRRSTLFWMTVGSCFGDALEMLWRCFRFFLPCVSLWWLTWWPLFRSAKDGSMSSKF